MNGFTLCSMYPKRAGLLINLGAGLMSISSMIPQAWLALVNAGVLTRSQIYYIWLGLSLLSLVLSTCICPWHSVTDPEYAPNFVDCLKSPLLSTYRPPMKKSLLNNLRTGLALMGSPVFWSQNLTKVAAHYVMTLSVTLANDMMMNSAHAKEVGYDRLQTQYELTRGVTRIVSEMTFSVDNRSSCLKVQP